MSLRYCVYLFLAMAFLGASVGFAQPFSSGSNGSDGALNFITPGTINFDPVALGLNPAGDNIFNFTTVNIGAGVTVNMTAGKLREKSVVWLATGPVAIAGTLNLSGAAGYPDNSPSSAQVPSQPGPGGYAGGVGGAISSPSQAGAGPGSGSAGGGGGAGGGAIQIVSSASFTITGSLLAND